MKLSHEVSTRIKLLRFPLIVGVVYIHTILPDVSPVTAFTHDLLAETVARLAVPLFFIISGFLFFINFDASLEGYLKKLKGRATTLLVPYLFWNLFFLIVLLALTSFPATLQWTYPNYRQPIAQYSISDFLNAFLAIKRQPILYPFWFLRDLMVLVVLSPIFFWMAKKVPYLALIVLALPRFFKSDFYVGIEWQSPFFYYLGGLLAVKNWDLSRLDKHKNIIIPAYLALAIVAAALRRSDYQLVYRLIQCIALLAGSVAAWNAVSLLSKKAQDRLAELADFAFFVYATHEPTVMILKRTIQIFAPPSNSISVLACDFFITGATIAICLAVGRALQKSAPKFFQVVTGGRG